MAEQKKQEKTAKSRSALYEVCRVLACFLFHTVLPVRYEHSERLQGDAPYIVIGNHVSLLDPIVVALAIPRYQVHFLAKKELAKPGIVRWFLATLHAIFVDRHNSDMEAMRACVRVLREGGVLGIFPEGTRHHQGLMEELESGVALMALRGGAPLIPVYLQGKLRLFRPLDVLVGEPIPMDDLRAEGVNTQTCQALMARITKTYADMAEMKKNLKKA